MPAPTMSEAGVKPSRIQLSRAKGWRMPPNTVKVDRSTKLGNPFPVDIYGQEGAVDRFRRWMNGEMSADEMSTSSRCDWGTWGDGPSMSLVTTRGIILKRMPSLRGKNLACWCSAQQPCHADVYLAIANADEERGPS